MPLYLKDVPLNEAMESFQRALEENGLWGILGEESISLDENAMGRVLSKPIWAKISSPHYHASAMDGFAVKASETIGAQPSTPLELAVGPSASYLDTGDALPVQFDAVIPIENVEAVDEHGKTAHNIRTPRRIRIRASVAPWSHIRLMGEDIIQSQLVMSEGHVLRPVDLGAIAAAGYHQIDVSRVPRVAILPTGTELVPIGSDLKPGDILEFNSIVLAAQLKLWGALPDRYKIIPDDFDKICDQVNDAAKDHDLILINAGSSAGAEDFTSLVVESLGSLIVHGIAVRPGHPVILGVIKAGSATTNGSRELAGGRCIPIIGVPGYPVSAALTNEIIVEPLLAKWLGRKQIESPVEPAQITRKITSPAGDDDYLRVIVGKVGNKTLAAPLSHGAGVISSLVRADGIVIVPRGVQGVEAGEMVDVHLYKSRAEIGQTIFCIGSHDMTLDLLSQFLSRYGRRLVSSNVGSQGGLLAIRRGETHVAGSHLLDPETGVYNLHQIKQYLNGIPVGVFGFVGRKQGLMIDKGNPKALHSLADVAASRARFINRQRGSGTRVLLDYLLAKNGINSSKINGYEQEEYTHLGVAAAIASGRAECGLGIPAAAQSLNLDFVPLFDEQYQLIVPQVYAKSDLLSPLFDILVMDEFKNSVAKMPGYDPSMMGQLIAEV